MQYLFVYGSLKSSVKTSMGNPYRDLMRKLATPVGDAYVHGRIYDLGAFPAVVHDETGPNVFGELWMIEEEDAPLLFSHLDEYEGTPHLYRREIVPVYVCEDNDSPSIGVFHANMYVWAQSENTINGRLLRDGEWSR